MNMSYRDFDEELGPYSVGTGAPSVDLVEHPVIASINVLAVALMEILGPFCWAALILLFLVAEFSSG
jgi:hypothetical protein